ncbi:alpha/beta fold hydrolase [Ornithinibacillus sp. BX22]|uniref:Alpha/beta fold hydrolase n=1 Tax=Ornithinibacillus hominis TaxID=2763055 RepID=A0A923L494_9BACI|nr:alpha/beta hydrolase [Ornithinibacillus hominis]MBC5636194.1 alpha/beta fold hydrolase [Ornithinibacillus hominis]
MQLEIDHIQIHYQLYNTRSEQSEYILLLHGLGLDLTMWEPIIPYLQDHFNIITFDMRGHGKTKADTSVITWDTLIEDLHTLITALNIPKFHAVGFGIGGNLAIKYLEQYPEKVDKLILASVYMYFPKEVTAKQLQKRKQMVTDGKISELAKNLIHQICHNLTPEKEYILMKAYNKVDQRTYFNFFEMLTKTVSLEELKDIDREVLLIQGEKDPLFPIQQTNLYQTYLHKSASYVVPNASNLVPLDNPYTFTTLVSNFIKNGLSNSFTNIIEQEFIKNIDYLISKNFNTLEINIINGFSVKYQGREITDKWNQRKAKNLLAYLAYHNSTSREALINEFWGEIDLVSAKNNLRVALNHLKSILQNHGLDCHLSIGRENISLVGDISFDLLNYMQLLYGCVLEKDLERKKSIFIELMSQYKERMFIDFYDEWLFAIQDEIDQQLDKIVRSLN